MIVLHDLCEFEQFEDITQQIRSRKKSSLCISSPGGNVTATIFFCNIIRKYIENGRLENVFVLDECSSSAFIIFLTFPKHKRYMSEVSLCTIHQSTTEFSDKSGKNKLIKHGENMDLLNKRCYDVCHLTNNEKNMLIKLEEKERILTPYDIVSLGLLDKKNIVPVKTNLEFLV